MFSNISNEIAKFAATYDKSIWCYFQACETHHFRAYTGILVFNYNK